MSALRRSAVGAARLALRDGASRGAIMTPRAIGATVGAETRAVERAPEGARGISLQAVKIRMRSVGNIQKITKAMKMVAASRLKGAQTKCEKSRAMIQPFVRLLGDMPNAETERTLVVPVSSDKGLCGGINTAVVKYTGVLKAINNGEAGLNVIGDKARSQLTRLYPQNVNSAVVDTTKQPLTFSTASAIADSILAENSPKTHLVYNRFVSAISFKPTVVTCLNSEELEKAAEEGANAFDSYEIEGPDRSELLLDLSEFKMGTLLYNAMLENNTSELGSRMQSMENSSKNASEMLSKLTLLYNRTRQAAITTELIEIISGASSLESAE